MRFADIDFGPPAAMVLALAIAACAPPPQHDRTDADRAELKGPVKDVTTTFRENRKDPSGIPDERMLGSAHYDPQGRLIEDEDYTPDFVRKRRPKRIDRNTILFQSAMGGSIEHYVFDANGNAIETDTWYGGKRTGAPNQIVRAKYDGHNCQIEQTFIGSDGKVGGGSIYNCDGDGNIIREDTWLNDPKRPHAVSTYTYAFDAQGNWTQRREKRSGVGDDSYDYGPAGMLIRTITYYGK